MSDKLSETLVNALKDLRLSSDKKLVLITAIEDQFVKLVQGHISDVSQKSDLTDLKKSNKELKKLGEEKSEELEENISNLMNKNNISKRNYQEKLFSKDNYKFHSSFIFDTIIFISIVGLIISMNLNGSIGVGPMTLLLITIFCSFMVYYVMKRKMRRAFDFDSVYHSKQ